MGADRVVQSGTASALLRDVGRTRQEDSSTTRFRALSHRFDGMADAVAGGAAKWALGVPFLLSPAEAMDEVYAALIRCDMEWHALGPYDIVCRPATAPRGIEIGCRMYRSEGKQAAASSQAAGDRPFNPTATVSAPSTVTLLDLRVIRGHPAAFCDTVTDLLRHLPFESSSSL